VRPYLRDVRSRLALLAVVVAAVLPAAARADDPPAPSADQTQPAPDPGSPAPDQSTPAPTQTSPAQEQSAPASDTPPACLPAKGATPDGTSLRGVRVGHRAVIKDSNGNALKVNSVSYCVHGGGVFTFALSPDSDVVLALSTARGDSIGTIEPRSSANAARAAFPKMTKVAKSGTGVVYRVDPRRQLIFGVAGGRVNFVAAADRLLLEYPGKLGYYLHRLGF
jgi:hypothetical protein